MALSCEMSFDILNRLGVADECDGQTDGRTEWPVAIARSNVVTRYTRAKNSQKNETDINVVHVRVNALAMTNNDIGSNTATGPQPFVGKRSPNFGGGGFSGDPS